MHRARALRKLAMVAEVLVIVTAVSSPTWAQSTRYLPDEATVADGASGRPVDSVSLLEIGGVGGPVLAPDGMHILFTRSSADWKQDGTTSHVWLVDIRGDRLRQMTNGSGSESSPRWAPDGTRVTFLASRGDADEGSQIWCMPVDGGEALQLSSHETGVEGYSWARDGSRIFFLAEDAKTDAEKTAEEASGASIRFPRNWKHRHLWWVDPDTGEEGRVTEGEFSVWGFGLAPAGGSIAYTRGPTPLLDDIGEVELWMLEIGDEIGDESDGDTGRTWRLTENEGIPEGSPAISPDGRWVAFSADAMPPGTVSADAWDFYYESNLFLISTGGGEPSVLLPGERGEIGRFEWLEDSSGFVASVNLGVHSELIRIDLEANDAGGVTATGSWLTGAGDAPSGTVAGFDLVPGYGLALLRAAPDNPGDLWYATVDPFDARRVTDLHADMQRAYALPRAEAVTWTGADGVDVEGILWYPIGFEEGARYPLVVQIHGGPASSVQLRMSTSWGSYIPVLTGMGYMVLQPNYRGGVGYGDAFLRDMVGAYFNQADDDVMTGVDALIERGLVDPERLAIMGWSAGGHMTNWIVTQTDRFAAGSSGAGASNWVSMYAQSDVRIYRTPWFGGSPWQEGAPLRAYLENSPVFDAWRATTPTLILVGERDVRVPMAQSIEMYRALKHSGADTKLVVFPGEPHGLRKLAHRLHKMNVEIEWFERHLHARDYEYAIPPGEEPADEQ